jgi:hypothetical protein
VYLRHAPHRDSLIYPSLLSLPYYLIYLATFGAWALDMFEGEENHAFLRAWERRVGCFGMAYSGLYMLVIYLLQVPAAAHGADLDLLRRCGVINVLEVCGLVADY